MVHLFRMGFGPSIGDLISVGDQQLQCAARSRGGGGTAGVARADTGRLAQPPAGACLPRLPTLASALWVDHVLVAAQ